MFGGLYFGQYWPEGAQQGDSAFAGGDYVESGYKKKRRPEDEVQWPQPWQFEEHKPAKFTPTKPEPKTEPVVARPVATVLPGKTEITVLDESIKEKARFIQMRIKRQLEEEELLTLMGFFD